MTENNAAQLLEAIRAAGYRDHPTNIERKRVDAILRAVEPLLSKLRAEGVQADDERAAPIKRYYHGTDHMQETLSGDWVRYDDHVAVLESSHAAGLADAAFLIRWDTHAGEPNAVQPLTYADKVAFSRAALASAPVADMGNPLSDSDIREVLLAHGFTIKDGQTDLKPYVYEAARALISVARVAADADKALEIYASRESAPVAGEAESQRATLMQAIGEAAAKAGIIKADWHSLSGPECLMLLDDLAHAAAPQASEAVRILFPTHLRKMWAGGEVQAWLDEHQGITPPKATAKGSLERYRKWQANQAQAEKDGGDCAKGAGSERQAWEADMVAAGAQHLGGECWEWTVPNFEFRLWQIAARRQQHAENAKAWLDLFWSVAKELNCLPSSFADGNDHVLRAARQARAALAAQPGTQMKRANDA